MKLVHIDPTKHFGEARADRIRTACGIIPHWWFTAVAKEGPEADAKTLYDALVEQYPFYMGPMEGATVDLSLIHI